MTRCPLHRSTGPRRATGETDSSRFCPDDDWLIGKFTIKLVSGGRKVVIDGVAVFKPW